jgi:RNA polymerase sigma-70 factor (ECF subfamily)
MKNAVMGGPGLEEGVLEACQQGDREAFRALYDAYKDSVYSIALHFSGNAVVARDIAQEVFLRLYMNIQKFRQEANFQTWLFRIVANACSDERRKRSHLVPLSPEMASRLPAHGLSQHDRIWQEQKAAAVRAAVASLKPKWKMPILLRYLQGLSYEQMAEALGCSKGVVASRLNRAHKLLARKLAPFQPY